MPNADKYLPICYGYITVCVYSSSAIKIAEGTAFTLWKYSLYFEFVGNVITCKLCSGNKSLLTCCSDVGMCLKSLYVFIMCIMYVMGFEMSVCSL